MLKIERREFLGGLAATASILPSELTMRDAGSVRAEFGLQPDLVYLQTGSLGPTPLKVLEAVQEYSKKLERNPAAMAYGELEQEMELIREELARFLNCSSDELSLTRSTTEGMNSLASGISFKKGDRILTSDQEHPGGRVCWDYVARRFGVDLDVVKIPYSVKSPAEIVDLFSQHLNEKTRVLSVSHVLSSNGLRMPVRALSELARKAGVLSVIDGAQAAGAVRVDIKEMGCDAYVTSGHKWMLGPKGTGLLFIARSAQKQISPISLQSGRQVYSASSGVSNIPEILGLRRAVAYLEEKGIDRIEASNLELRRMLAGMLQSVEGVQIVSPTKEEMLSPMLAFKVRDNVDSGKLKQVLLSKYRIEVKHVPGNWFNGLRISTHFFNTESDIRALVKALKNELK